MFLVWKCRIVKLSIFATIKEAPSCTYETVILKHPQLPCSYCCCHVPLLLAYLYSSDSMLNTKGDHWKLQGSSQRPCNLCASVLRDEEVCAETFVIYRGCWPAQLARCGGNGEGSTSASDKLLFYKSKVPVYFTSGLDCLLLPTSFSFNQLSHHSFVSTSSVISKQQSFLVFGKCFGWISSIFMYSHHGLFCN